MTMLSPTDIYNVALQAGFTPDQAVTWTAIALAESRGDPTAHNPSGEDSRGLWQVNVASDVRDNPWGDLYDPLTNARAAYEISKQGTDMRPWTTTHASNQGSPADYRTYMDEARAAAGGAYPGDFSGVSGYRDPNPMGAAEPTGPVPGAAGAAPAAPMAPAEPDADRDGASDAFEMSKGTDPHVADTDRDGLTDGFELARGANPLALDTDADGLSDAYEVEIRTDLLAADTDADGLGDAAEVAAGRDAAHGVPVGPDGQPLAQGPAVDTDQDGLSDAFEGALGTDMAQADTDGDGLSDAMEQAGGTDPLHVDTDRDGIVDDVDIDPLGGPGGIAGIAGIAGVPAPAAGPPPMPGAVPPPPVPDPAAGGDDQAVRTFLDAALAQTGDPYVWASEADVGDADPTEFDCSELAQWAAGQVGVELPDGSWLQYLELKEQGAVIPVEQAVHTPGALLFSFDREPTPGGGRPGSAHVAISLGDGNTIEARGTRYGVGSWETGDRFQYAAIVPGVDGTGSIPPAAPGAAVVAPAAPAGRHRPGRRRRPLRDVGRDQPAPRRQRCGRADRRLRVRPRHQRPRSRQRHRRAVGRVRGPERHQRAERRLRRRRDDRRLRARQAGPRGRRRPGGARPPRRRAVPRRRAGRVARRRRRRAVRRLGVVARHQPPARRQRPRRHHRRPGDGDRHRSAGARGRPRRPP